MASLWQIKAGFVAQREPTAPEPTKTNLKEMSRPSEGASAGAPEPKQKRPRTEDQNAPNKAVRFNRCPPSKEESNKSELNNNVLQHHDSSQERIDPQDKQPQIAPVKKTVRPASTPKTSERNRRTRQPVERLIEAMATETSQATADNAERERFCLQATCPGNSMDETKDPIMACKAASDPDTVHMHQAMQEPDKKQFVKAMRKEARDQLEKGNFTVMHKLKLPKGAAAWPQHCVCSAPTTLS
jgi:hypothetical protein